MIAGVYPFLLGLAVGLLMLTAVQSHRIWLASLLAVLALSAHVLAFGFVGLFLIAWALAGGGWRRDRGYRAFAIVIIVLACGAAAAAARVLPAGRAVPVRPEGSGGDPGVLRGRRGPLIPPARDAGHVGVLLALRQVTVIDFAVPNAVGGNMVRLIAVAGLPLLLIPLAARRYRPGWIAAVCIAVIAVWQGISPVTEWQASSASPGQNAAFWTPALKFLATHADPNYRVEVVQSKRYWESYYIAGHGYAMARGWYRQDDYPTNAILYNRLSPSAYQAWLRSVGVHYVLLQAGTLDFSAQAEADLLRSGTSGLQLVARTGNWSVYALPNPTPIVTPAAAGRVTAITPTTITIQATRSATLTVRVHNTPYWTVQSAGGSACVDAGTGATTPVAVRSAGPITLRFAVRATSVVRALLGERVACPAVPARERPRGG